MQAKVGSSINYAGLQVSYTYGARYLYTDIVILNDNFLRLSACVDAFQTPMSSSVITAPAARPVQYMDRQGNPTHRVRLTAPHTELTILAVGNVRLISPPWTIEEMAMSVFSYDAGADEFLSPTPMVDPEKVADAARQIAGGSQGLIEVVDSVVGWVYSNIFYIRGNATVARGMDLVSATTAEQVLQTRQGVCQDMTHLAMGMLAGSGHTYALCQRPDERAGGRDAMHGWNFCIRRLAGCRPTRRADSP